jgi:hypothetical protein
MECRNEVQTNKLKAFNIISRITSLVISTKTFSWKPYNLQTDGLSTSSQTPQSMLPQEPPALSSRLYDADNSHSLQVIYPSFHVTPNFLSSHFIDSEDAYVIEIIYHSPFLVGLGMILVLSLGTSPTSFINDAGKFG